MDCEMTYDQLMTQDTSKKKNKCNQRSNTQEFINKAIQVHGDRYSYVKTEYINSKEPIIIICSIHGDFSQTPNSHLRGRGCRKCGYVLNAVNRAYSTVEFIDKSKKVHADKYYYHKVKYIKSNVPVIITCSTHGDFPQTPVMHLVGQGCPECFLESKKSNTEEFINKAWQVHGDRYSYDKSEYINSNEPLTITCSIHGDFPQTPNNHLSGYQCIKCGQELRKLKNSSNTNEFIDKAKQVHSDKYSYDKVEYINSKQPVIITCPKHGDFPQQPNSHLNGQGCPECFLESSRSTTEEFINKAIQVHGDRYSYNKTIYIRASESLTITCSIHGDFSQSPNGHLQGQGCQQCARESSRSTTEEFIDKAKKVHGDRYSYKKTNYIYSAKPVIITCNKHGDFSQTPTAHLASQGCPNCVSSKGEILIAKFLNDLKINFVTQKKFSDCLGINTIRPRKLPFDFYLPDFNIIVEFDGVQHFRPVDIFGGDQGFIKLKINDEIKDKYCKDNEIKIIRIPYTMNPDDILFLLKNELQVQ
jgi:hypothetical protein